MKLNQKTALITGGSRGIGKAIALRLAQEGANIALVYAGNHQAAEETKAQVEALGVRVKTYSCDVSDFEATKAVVQSVLEDFGGVDILVNNAGIVRDGLVLSMKEEDFARVLSINLTGAFHMIRHLYSHFMRKRSGRIINISSVVGLNGNAGQANYSAAKAGLIGLTESVAKELAGRNVTCNAIAPGYDRRPAGKSPGGHPLFHSRQAGRNAGGCGGSCRFSGRRRRFLYYGRSAPGGRRHEHVTM